MSSIGVAYAPPLVNCIIPAFAPTARTKVNLLPNLCSDSNIRYLWEAWQALHVLVAREVADLTCYGNINLKVHLVVIMESGLF